MGNPGLDVVRMCARSSREEVERLKGDLATREREARDLRVEIAEMHRARAKVEEERDRILRRHNETVRIGRQRPAMTFDRARQILVDTG